MKRSLITFMLLLMSLSPRWGMAQSVGVVMNGGGAKGLYHVGVLEALEESGVPIDYVAGTSMGAIVAGLYAAGYSPQEMRELALSDELESWVTGYIDPNSGYYFRSNCNTLLQSSPLLSLRLGGGGVSGDVVNGVIPKSLVSTTQIDMALNRIFSSATVACGGDFSHLMIPFLSVASDVTAGRDTISMSGDLGLAIRASMSIPLVYKPVVDERGHMLFDGGVYNNFPIADMQREYNPDFIIGVSCTDDNIQPSSALSLVDQAMALMMNRRVAEMPENGMLIERQVEVGMLDFSSAAKVMQMGYNDAMVQMDSLMGYIRNSNVRSAEYYNDRRSEFNSRKPDLLFNSYHLRGLTRDQNNYVQRSMRSTRKRRSLSDTTQVEISFERLQNNLYKVLSTGDFVTDYPEVLYDDSTKRYGFEMKMAYKPSWKLTVGGNLSSTPFNQVYLGLNYTSIHSVKQSANLELYLGPVYNTGRLGYRAEFYSRFPIFMDAYYNFSSKNLRHGVFGQIGDVDNTRQVKFVDNYLSLGAGTPIMRRSYLQLRANVGREEFDYDVNEYETNGQGVFDRTQFSYVATKIDIEKSTLDDLYYPTKGASLSLSPLAILGREVSFATQVSDSLAVSRLEAPRSWVGVKLNYKRFFFGDSRLSVGVSLDGILTTIPDMYAHTSRQFLMPAFQPIAHSKMVYMPEYSAPCYLAAGVIPTLRLTDDFHIRGEVYAMLRDRYVDPLMIEPSIPSGDKSLLSVKYVAQAALVYNSNLGAMSLALSKYNLSNWDNLYLTFNFGYTIFSPRGTFD